MDLFLLKICVLGRNEDNKFIKLNFFRENSLSFKVIEQLEKEAVVDRNLRYSYPAMGITLKDFKLEVEMGEFTDSEIIVLLGENGTGKTTLIR